MLVYKVVWKMRDHPNNRIKRPCRFEGWYLLGFIPLLVIQKEYIDNK